MNDNGQNVILTYVPGARSEFEPSFFQGMIDRMAVSFYKYGAVREAYPSRVNAVVSLLVRLISYMGIQAFQDACDAAVRKSGEPKKPGNTEYLIDAGNFAMIEFMFPSLKGAYYEATDSNGSPGRAWNGQGEHNLTQRSNRIERRHV